MRVKIVKGEVKCGTGHRQNMSKKKNTRAGIRNKNFLSNPSVRLIPSQENPENHNLADVTS